MSITRPISDDLPLAEGPCAVVIGPMSFSGHITLTTRRVSFKPTSFSARIGVEPWAVEIASIRSAHLGGAESSLSLVCAQTLPRVVGLGARIVHERLSALLTDGGDLTYHPGERVLLHASASVEWNDLMSAVGEVTVTTRRIRFRPNRMDRLLWPDTAFETDHERVTHFSVGGVRPGLEVRTPTDRRRFIGDVIPALYAALRSNAEVRGGEVHPDCASFAVWPAALCSGPVMHQGALLHTATRLAFVATGLLDSLVGVQGVTEFPVGTITALALRGQFDHRLVVSSHSGQMTIAGEQLKDRYADLLPWLAAGGAGPVWVGDGPPPEDVAAEIEAVLGPWRAFHRLSERVRLFTPGVAVVGNVATTGWLLVTTGSVVWLPGLLTPDTAPVLIPLTAGPWRWDDDPDELRAEVGKTSHRWLTKARRAFRVALFQDLARTTGRAAHDQGAAAELGNRRDSFRVEVPDDWQSAITVWGTRDGKLHSLDCRIVDLSLGGIGIALGDQLPAGASLRVDLVDGRRTLSVDAKVTNSWAGPHGVGWRSGITFASPQANFEDALRTLWMELQRLELKRLSGGRDVDY